MSEQPNTGREPIWTDFIIDDKFDPPGVKQGKIEGFIRAFIEWRGGGRPPTVMEAEVIKPAPNKRKTTKRRKKAA